MYFNNTKTDNVFKIRLWHEEVCRVSGVLRTRTRRPGHTQRAARRRTGGEQRVMALALGVPPPRDGRAVASRCASARRRLRRRAAVAGAAGQPAERAAVREAAKGELREALKVRRSTNGRLRTRLHAALGRSERNVTRAPRHANAD